jgi:hypothetical protein
MPREGECQGRLLHGNGGRRKAWSRRASWATGHAYRKAQKQARLSDTRVADQHEDEQVIICEREGWSEQAGRDHRARAAECEWHRRCGAATRPASSTAAPCEPGVQARRIRFRLGCAEVVAATAHSQASLGQRARETAEHGSEHTHAVSAPSRDGRGGSNARYKRQGPVRALAAQ